MANVPKLLIDGYNVLFESNLVGKGRGRDWLVKARGRLLQLLQQQLTPQELRTTHIVFDAPAVGPAPEAERLASGLSVEYAIDHAEADDLLEQIIRQHPTPKQLTVVSSDQRIRQCARAKRAISLASDDFLAQLEGRPPALPESDVAALPPPPSDNLSASEVEYWLREFGSAD